VNPSEWIAALTWRDGLDFLLLFAVVYGLLRVVRRTRAAPALAAVAAFGVVAWVVRALDLIAVASLLRYVFDSLVLLLIVAFHQELRRLLLALGQRLLPGAGRRRATVTAVGEIATALARMQAAHVGALIVLQGEIDVLAAVQNRGVEIDAPVRADLLVALCVPHPANAVHDGAIIVHALRVARAGVICPLSEQHIDHAFGTRHRAALGVSEETDALVLVLSEERGELRIVYRGAISESLRVADLEARIVEWLAAPRAVAGGEGDAANGDVRVFEPGAEAPDASLSAIALSRSAVLDAEPRRDEDASRVGTGARG
jgi:diadenylate cyclase